MNVALDLRSLLRSKIPDPIRLQKSLQQVGIPRPVRDRIVVGTKRMLAPGEESRRIRLATQLNPPHSVDLDSFMLSGSGILDSSSLPSARPAALDAQKFFSELKDLNRITKPEGHRKAQFLIQIVGDDELLSRPKIAEFVLCDELVSLATHYLGQVPVLSSVCLLWSPPNETVAESQFYHYDGEDRSQLKIILNVNDVDVDTGPFTFMSAQHSANVARTRRHSVTLKVPE